MTAANPDAVYACVNLDFACCPAGDCGAVALYPRGHFGGAGGAGGNGLTNRRGCDILLQNSFGGGDHRMNTPTLETERLLLRRFTEA